jgi:scyllo-inositol 2-dehydrogenase (NADP+)
MRKIKIALVSAGNIMKSRHLPALMTAKNRFEIIGIVDTSAARAEAVAKQYGIPHSAAANDENVSQIPWMQSVEAIIAAPPPKAHAPVVRSYLTAGKHVLVEKPFVTDIEAGRELIQLAAQKNLIVAVNQNFQFSGAFSRLQKVIDDSETFGAIKSFYCIQFSNDTRRLPSWGDDLPLGLFYDESPHVFYLLRRFAKGELVIKDVAAVKSRSKENTPQILNVEVDANGIPATIYSNFESPICEWYFIVFGERRYAMVDMFRDILTVLPNDGQHLMKEVFTTSFLASMQHWKGFISNGFKYVRHRLHYGMDQTHENFYQAIVRQDSSPLDNMSGADGLAVNIAQRAVCQMVRR